MCILSHCELRICNDNIEIMDLTNKTVVYIGGANGLGWATCKELAVNYKLKVKICFKFESF